MVKALIVGVSEYYLSCNDLPLCLKDIHVMKEALVLGLAVKEENIIFLGENKTVSTENFIDTLDKITKSIDNSDTFIFYFSGHGAKRNNENYLVFSNDSVSMNALISFIDKLPCKNKIVMLDSCCSGNKDVSLDSPIDINETAEQFIGHGCAILASCDFDESSGFDIKRDMSLYTRILYDALTSPFLIRQGKKSLEDIKQYVDRLANIANKSLKDKQHNAFRSSIVGTIFFEIEEYAPYKSERIYKETERYIIYSVEPTHANVKRVSLKVILKFPCSVDDIANIAEEINQEALYYEVFNNKISENRWSGYPNNIIFAYYGYDETDMINSSYAFRSTWIDKDQNKERWYRVSDNSSIINDIWIEEINGYSFMKKFISDNTSDDETLIDKTRTCMYKMIIAAEQFLSIYREYINRTTTEVDFINQTKNLSSEIRNLYFEQSDLHIPSKNLHNWSTAYSSLAAAIDDFVIAYDPNTKRDSNNRRQLMDITIKRYNECLERVKELDAELANKIDN